MLQSIKLLSECLRELSSRAEQERVWMNADNPLGEMPSFEEAYCGIYDDCDLGRQLEKGLIEEPYATHFLVLDKLMERIPSMAPPEEVVKSPDMEEIRAKALQILKQMRLDGLID